MKKASTVVFALLACASVALAIPSVPEIDPGSATQGVALLLGSGILYRFRRSR